MVGEHADAFELGVVEQVGFVDDQDGGAAAFGVLGGEGVGGLGDEGGGVGAGWPAEGGDDGVVDAAGADGGVAEVDDGVAGGVEGGQGGADGDGLAGADLAGDDAEGLFGDAPGDPGDGFGVGGVAVQHAGGEVAAERHPGEAVEALQLVDAHWSSWSWRGPRRWSWPGSWPGCRWAAGRGCAEQGGVVDPLGQLAAWAAPIRCR